METMELGNLVGAVFGMVRFLWSGSVSMVQSGAITGRNNKISLVLRRSSWCSASLLVSWPQYFRLKSTLGYLPRAMASKHLRRSDYGFQRLPAPPVLELRDGAGERPQSILKYDPEFGGDYLFKGQCR